VMKKHTPLGVQEGFFRRPTGASRRKLQIVGGYFDAYMNVLARDREVGYADLFAGPGRYENGERSVPLVICEKVVANERLRNLVRLWFNEGDADCAAQLERNIETVDGIATLRHAPRVTKLVISKALAPRMEKLSIPTFIFADPCGYKGLSLRLIAATLKGFGNDCLFFFNYNRVNMKLGYPVMDESIDEFFEPDRAAALRAEVGALKAAAREKRVLGAIQEALQLAGAMPLTFAFRTREGGGTSHHLVFASKSRKGVTIMKRLMNQASSEIIDGVGSFDFDPRDEGASGLLFSGLDEVRQRLLSAFVAGRTATFDEIIEEETALTHFTETNYRDALLELEAETESRVIMEPPATCRPFQPGGLKRTLSGRTRIPFLP
jgi:three-Cys-motif partner protein